MSGRWECELQSAGVPVATVRFLVRGEVPPLAESEAALTAPSSMTATAQPAPADLTIAVAPGNQGAAAHPGVAGQESDAEVVDFSESKLLGKWVRVPGAAPARQIAAQAPVRDSARPLSASQPAPRQIAQQTRPQKATPSPRYTPSVIPPAPVPTPQRALSTDSFTGRPGVVVVVSSNQYEKSAQDEVRALRAKGYPAFLGQYKDPRTGRLWHTVRLEGFGSLAQARKAKHDFMRREGRQAFVAVRGSVPNPQQQPVLEPLPASTVQPYGQQQPRPVALPSQTAYPKTSLLPPPMFSVQVGACLLPESARTMERELRAKGYSVRIVLLKDAGGKLWHRVLLGNPYVRSADAWQAVHAYRAREGSKAYVIDNTGRVIRK